MQFPSPLSHKQYACVPPAVPARFNIYPTLNNRCTGLHQQDSLYLGCGKKVEGCGRKGGRPWRGDTARHGGLVSTSITLYISCKLIVKVKAVACHGLPCARRWR